MSAFLASIFYFKCRAGHYALPIDDYVKPNGTRLTRHSSDQDVLPIPKCHTKLFQFSYFNRIAKLWNSYLNPLVLLLLLISLNLTYSNVILLLFVQPTTSLTLTPGSRSAANAVGHLIYWDFLSAAGLILSYRFWKWDFYTSYNVLMFYTVFVYT